MIYTGDITYNGQTCKAHIEDSEDGNAILYGRLGWCGIIIEMASGGLYDEKELEKAKPNYNGPEIFTIGDITYRDCKWTLVKHEASCACCCRGVAEFNYKSKMTYEEAETYLKEWSRKLVKKWDKTGLLDGINSDLENSNMAVLLESQPKQILRSEMPEEERKWDDAMMIVYGRKMQKTSQV